MLKAQLAEEAKKQSKDEGSVRQESGKTAADIEKKKEAVKVKKTKKKQEPAAPEEMPAELKQDLAYKAAQINQEAGFSFVCAAAYRLDKIYIVERMGTLDGNRIKRYRVKKTTYQFFATLDDAMRNCQRDGAVFQYVADYKRSASDEAQPIRKGEPNRDCYHTRRT